MTTHTTTTVLLFLLTSLSTGCATAVPDASVDPPVDPGPDGQEPFDPGFIAQSSIETVDDAVHNACGTVAVIGLSNELVDEFNCIESGLISRVDDIDNVELGGSALPYLQTPAADALAAAAATADEPIRLNSTMRTLPQQFMLFQWKALGLCGQTNPAATPGYSNHHAGLAIDVDNHEAVREDLEAAGFTWYGDEDKPHFTYTGEGAQDVRDYAVRAFQRLWNQSHPLEPLGVDGDWGDLTEAALERAPADGFGVGATCGAAVWGPGL